MGEFYKEFGEGLSGFPTAVVAEGNYGGIFQEMWRGFARISNSTGG